MIVQREDAPGKSGAGDSAGMPGDPAGIQAKGFFKADRRLLLNDDLSPTETVLLIGIGLHDWGDGRGGWPCNDTLVRFAKLKADGPDRGHKAIRKLLKGLKARGYISVETFKPTKENPTGRILRLLPKAAGDRPDIRVHRPPTSGSTDPRGEGLQTRTPPGPQTPQIDPGFIDPKEDPSSGDDNVAPLSGEEEKTPLGVLRLREQARKTFGDRARVDAVMDAIPGALALAEGKVPEPERVVSVALSKAGKAKPGGEGGYFLKCVENAIKAPSEKPRGNPAPTPPPAVEIAAKRDADARVGQAKDAILETRWLELSYHERDQIERHVRANNDRKVIGWKPVFHAYCLDEMDRRYAPETCMAMA